MDSVLAKDGANAVVNSVLPSPDVGALRDSGYAETSMSSVDLAHPQGTLSIPVTSASLPNMSTRRRYEAINIDSALANEAFRSYRMQERSELEKVSAFECYQRKALSAHHQRLLNRFSVQHRTNKAEKAEQVRLSNDPPSQVAEEVQHNPIYLLRFLSYLQSFLQAV